ncbi:MAG: (d)CMP kinase [Candidatus Omnitrophota bacterium]|nr:(d)CMP kinase [Candidatus Omnitrophota bacterium]
MKTRVIAIDGPAGAGKSTVAKDLAKKLKFIYLDTGAMYRALTLKALRRRIPLDDQKALVSLLRDTNIEIKSQKDGRLSIILDNEDVTPLIRTNKVTENVSYVAKMPKVRTIMAGLQRKFGKKNNIVVEGRDIGTVVFPNAEKKFYLDADFKERVRRRYKELKEIDKNIIETKIKRDLKERDTKDLTRKVAPLKKAEDAIYLDTTNLTIEEVVQDIIKEING